MLGPATRTRGGGEICCVFSTIIYDKYYYIKHLLELHIYYLQAEGKPDPEILWFKHDAPVIQSSSVKVVNDGTELRINRCCI